MADFATQNRYQIFGVHDDRTIEQLQRCVAAGDEDSFGVLCADAHVGYSQPIGGVVAHREYISPSGVGFDIGCGNLAIKTDLKFENITGEVPRIMDEITKRISFGMGRKNNESVDTLPIAQSVLTEIRNTSFKPQRDLYDLAANQLGTVGAGNHYVDLFVELEKDPPDGADPYTGYFTDSPIWIGIHFGSRGFGHKTASGFLALAQGLKFGDKASEGGMDAPPTMLLAKSGLGEEYIWAMTLAGNYAYAGRDTVGQKVLEILGAKSLHTVHNHHNYAWYEEHEGEWYYVTRKGATPAFPGQEGFVGGSMGDFSVILEGVESDLSERAAFSTIHGAGRQMSRTEAAGKVRRKKLMTCNSRDCEKVLGRDVSNAGCGVAGCPKKFSKRWTEERVSEGKVDWGYWQKNLRERGIELRGGAADEAPAAYKDLEEVLSCHAGTIKINSVLRPIGVAMAGHDVRDDFRD